MVGGATYFFEEQLDNESVDRFTAVQAFVDGVFFHNHPLTMARVYKIFGVSKSGYLAWLKRQRRNEPTPAEQYDNMLKEKMREILIARYGIVPGSRTFKAEFARRYNLIVSRKKIVKLMEAMNLKANRPLKDPYKHAATHDHPYASLTENVVNRNFFIGPRKVILTDITYLYYGTPKCPFYLCVFSDAYTREKLGWKVSRGMSVERIVKPAYEMMMKNHGTELSSPDVYIHSDQGSVYMSTTFKQLLSDDNFVQSVSGRGNSLDNSPMESFFNTLKTAILNLVALASDFKTAKELVEGYIESYNSEFYQTDLAYLTPNEFYAYVTFGVYPCDSYFGVDKSRLKPIDDLIRERAEKAAERAKQEQERIEREKQENPDGGKDPIQVILRDIGILEKKETKWSKKKATIEETIKAVKATLQKAEKALEFVKNADDELKQKLRHKQEWHNHKELAYIFEMQGMF